MMTDHRVHQAKGWHLVVGGAEHRGYVARLCRPDGTIDATTDTYPFWMAALEAGKKLFGTTKEYRLLRGGVYYWPLTRIHHAEMTNTRLYCETHDLPYAIVDDPEIDGLPLTDPKRYGTVEDGEGQ
jgi:hypothetical protein